MENNENLEAVEPKKTTQKQRFDGFALAHIFISVIGFGVGAPVGLALSGVSQVNLSVIAMVAGDAVLLLMYAFTGAWMARKKQWSFPWRFREGLWAFLAPALVAWAWGGLVIVSLYLNAWPLLMVAFAGSMVFAFPSSLMVLLAIVLGLLDSSMFAGLSVWALLAGGIPPLLFFLGSLWGSRKQREKENNCTGETEGEIDV